MESARISPSCASGCRNNATSRQTAFGALTLRRNGFRGARAQISHMFRTAYAKCSGSECRSATWAI